jgi:G3E family GTPase
MTMKRENLQGTPGASPVYVIGGFLGSGKTTLLKRLLRRELKRGVRPGVLMNEFGETDVDGVRLTIAISLPTFICGRY